MRRLFLKVFLWFWGTMGIMGAALYLAITTTTPDPLPVEWRESASKSFVVYSTMTRDVYEREGPLAASLTLTKLRVQTDLNTLLLDSRGTILSAHDGGIAKIGSNLFQPPRARRKTPSAAVRDEQIRNGDFAGTFPNAGPNFLLALLGASHAVFERTQKTGQPEFEVVGRAVILAQKVPSTVSANTNYVVLSVTSRPRGGWVPIEPSVQALRALVVFLTGGVLCYGLVRYLTTPIAALSSATHRLAEGDFSARAGFSLTRRRDELADLGRDFDTMAERVEHLMNSERHLVEAQRRLLGDISHELRSPLARLTMSLALARRHANGANGGFSQTAQVDGNGAVTALPTTSSLTTSLDRIGREAERLNALIEQLLSLVRLESGEATKAKMAVNIGDLVREVAADADFEARARGRQVQVLRTNDCKTTGDPDLLRSAIENVVRNAIAYTEDGTSVEVTLDCRKSHEAGNAPREEAIICVRDHGTGVPEEALSDLFRPFYRVETARDRGSGGVGLGLSIAERAVRSHGGTVKASNAPDGGLRVEITLPLIERTATQITKSEPIQPAA